MAPILLDQNIPKRVREWLEQRGFETVILADVNLRGASDRRIAEFAARNRMAVLTQDADFAKLYHTLYRRRLGVILVNTKEGTAQSITEAISKAQRRIDLKNTQNNLVIVTKNRLRIVS